MILQKILESIEEENAGDMIDLSNTSIDDEQYSTDYSEMLGIDIVDIPDDAIVDLVKDGEVVRSGTWESIKTFITTDHTTLYGTYSVIYDNTPVYTNTFAG